MSRFRAGATPQARVQSLADRAAALPRWPWARGHNVSLSARVVDDETLVGIHHKIMLHARDAKIAQELVECGARNARCPRGKNDLSSHVAISTRHDAVCAVAYCARCGICRPTEADGVNHDPFDDAASAAVAQSDSRACGKALSRLGDREPAS